MPMRIYLGGPIDGRSHNAFELDWKRRVSEWINTTGHVAVDPEIIGNKILAAGGSLAECWEQSQHELTLSTFALFHWGETSVGTHIEVNKWAVTLNRSQALAVWGLPPQRALQRAALAALAPRFHQTLQQAVYSCTQSLAMGDENLGERYRETWDTIYSSPNKWSSSPEPSSMFIPALRSNSPRVCGACSSGAHLRCAGGSCTCRSVSLITGTEESCTQVRTILGIAP